MTCYNHASIVLVGVLAFILCSHDVDGLPFTGMKPNSFREGELVPLKVNALTSTKTQAPIDYYKLPFCHPVAEENKNKDFDFNVDTIAIDKQNLGQYLSGSRIHSSPYTLRMKEDMYCQQLCVVDMGEHQDDKNNDDNDDNKLEKILNAAEKANKNRHKREIITKAIQDGYHHNWIVDDMNAAASRLKNGDTIVTRFWGGIPVGYVDAVTKRAYINNHMNIIIHYHTVHEETDIYRVVRFIVEPFSIHHEIKFYEQNQQQDKEESDNKSEHYIHIKDPIRSCVPTITKNPRDHISFDMFASSKNNAEDFPFPKGSAGGRFDEKQNSNTTSSKPIPQLAEGLVLFTYDVIWKENEYVHWANRWDMYLNADHAIPLRAHWISIAKSMAVILFLIVGMTITIRKLRRAAKLTPLPEDDNYDDDEKEEENTTTFKKVNIADDEKEKSICGSMQKKSGTDLQKWRLLHADVFRSPSTSPLVFSVCCGTGAHLLATFILFLFLAIIGVASISRRGSIPISLICIYPLTSIFGGYTTVRFYQMLLNGATGSRETEGIDCSNSSNNDKYLIASMALTAIGFPGMILVFFVLIQTLASQIDSTIALPSSYMLYCFLGFEVASTLLLTFLGGWIGYVRNQRQAITFPTEVSKTPRDIPGNSAKSILCSIFSFLMNGFLPFLAGKFELFYFLFNYWLGCCYIFYGFLLLMLMLVVITTSQLNILTTYWQLCREDHLWWWKSWWNGASTGFYVFIYSIWYYHTVLHNEDDENEGTLFVRVFYFGSMILVCLSISLVLAFSGVLSSLWFNRTIYAMIVESV